MGGCHPGLGIGVCGGDEALKRALIRDDAGPDFDMAHESPCAAQKLMRISQDGTEVKAHVDVRWERRDIAKGQIADASGGLTIVEQFQHVGTARSNSGEPSGCDSAKLAGQRGEPTRHSRIIPLCAFERELPCVRHVSDQTGVQPNA